MCQDCEYALRWNPETDTLQLSSNEAWQPWLPQEVFGWQILNEGQLRDMFFCPQDFINSVDFKTHLVLAVIRYDEVSWKFFPKKVRFSPKEARLSLSYQAVTKTLQPGKKVISSAIFLVEITEKISRLGLTNLLFEVAEEQSGPWQAGQSPYPAPAPEFWFPAAYSRLELRQVLDLQEALLGSMSPPTEQPSGWIPDYLELRELRLARAESLPETTYMIIDDSLLWAHTFLPVRGQRPGEVIVLNNHDFQRYFAVVVIKRGPGVGVNLGEMAWVENGLRLNFLVTERPLHQGPGLSVLLMPRGDYGVISFRENGEIIGPDWLR